MSVTKVSFRQIDWLFFVFFYVSWLNSFLGFLFYIALISYWRYGAEGGLKALIFLTTRGILSTAVAATPMFSAFRWVIIIGSSIIILYNARLSGKNKNRFGIIVLCIIGFDFIGVMSICFVCSYPLTSAFKLLSYSIVFLSVLLSISATNYYVDWTKFLILLYLPLFVISFCLIPFDKFRIVNDDFQGVFNHVNMFGIAAAIIITFVLSAETFEGRKIIKIIVLTVMIFMIYLSASRTGMFTSLGAIFLFALSNRKNIKKCLLCFFIIGCAFLLVCYFNDSFIDIIHNFIFKQGEEESIWYSRQDIIATYKQNFEASKLLGTGFMVPYIRGIIDYGLYFDLNVEPGNILWMLLGDMGILGLFSFISMFLILFRMRDSSKIYMLATPLFICMGEMVFFNPNNISILLYIMIGLCLFNDRSTEINNERG